MDQRTLNGELIARARAFAVAAHGDQRYGASPYVVHLQAVAQHVELYGSEPVIIAYLHDVVEDTPVELADIEREFGASIARCVALLTDEPGANRRERKQKTHAKLARVSSAAELPALIVKAADRLANLEACRVDGNLGLTRMYRDEHAAFRHAVFRPALCDPLWQAIELLVARR
ncbi:MAG: HD domain-containing protein [Deltaproteobacteria bacterium]|nr:HD domain-containing protein [Deltaproteobacteria bacterium]